MPMKRETMPTQVGGGLASSAISSACLCLTIPTSISTSTVFVQQTATAVSTLDVTMTPLSTVAILSTVTDIESQLSTQVIDATAFETFVPATTISTTTTALAQSTSVIKKSDIIKSIAAVVSSQTLQSFCSVMLGYTTPIVVPYQTATFDVTATVLQTTEQTQTIYLTATSVGGETFAKRDVTSTSVTSTSALTNLPMTTPFARDGYSNNYVSSGCTAAVASPTSASTLYLTTSYTSTVVDTVLETSTLTQTSVVATATVDIITDPSFELNDGASNGWVGWSIIAVKDVYDGNNIMELTTSSSEPTAVFSQNNIGPLNTTATYNISFRAMPVVLPSSCYFALIQEGITEGKVYGTGTSSTWTEYTFAIPGTAPNVEMMLQCSTPSDVYFDAFQAVLAD